MTVSNLEDFNKLNNKLKCYQHRLIKRIARFIYKFFNNQHSPSRPKTSLVKNSDQKWVAYDLRSKNKFFLPHKSIYNDHMEWTFFNRPLQGLTLVSSIELNI
ncbi:hypothetical protein BpHYR1_017581 [Brachionus plicatilis]|uniref:Uncharacterized protein n=1 Tax=Brachionus plicatilis TaxID=10195 RepID=A0A3M7QGV7_BRAPC|nr:hypothetical protein BpHYR1_017581 [Brachionus plicatilis]